MLYEIRNRYIGAVLFSLECGSLKLCVEAAVAAKADLRDANLCGANLYGADLCGADLRDADLRGANLCGAGLCGADLCDADLCGADLCDADLRDADLREADLCGADLRDADVIDAGQDRRGFRFWAWRKDGATVYRAGCHEWTDFADALAWYGEGYKSNGDRFECLARLALLRDEAARRWPAEAKQAAA